MIRRLALAPWLILALGLGPAPGQPEAARTFLRAGTGETLRLGPGPAVASGALGAMTAQACTSPQATLCVSGAGAICSFRTVLAEGGAGLTLDLIAGNPPEACARLAGRYTPAP
ncbi:hypothetical protein [Methylobacterium sp. JK268]